MNPFINKKRVLKPAIISYAFILVQGCATTINDTCPKDLSPTPPTTQALISNFPGHWYYGEKGKGWYTMTDCHFLSSGTYRCHRTEQGKTGHGWWEAHHTNSAGLWRIEKAKLILTPDRNTDSVLFWTKAKIKHISPGILLLEHNSGYQQTWLSNQTCLFEQVKD